VYSTYLGGSGVDYGISLALDTSGNLYVLGRTYSTDFPILNAFQKSLTGNSDAFVVKIARSGPTISAYVPHVANGHYGGGSFHTTLILFNQNDISAKASIRLSDDNGDPLTVTIPDLGTASRFDLTLETGATRIVQTDGSGDLVAGAARSLQTSTSAFLPYSRFTIRAGSS
jgi:hypothetical protein